MFAEAIVWHLETPILSGVDCQGTPNKPDYSTSRPSAPDFARRKILTGRQITLLMWSAALSDKLHVLGAAFVGAATGASRESAELSRIGAKDAVEPLWRPVGIFRPSRAKTAVCRSSGRNRHDGTALHNAPQARIDRRSTSDEHHPIW